MAGDNLMFACAPFGFLSSSPFVSALTAALLNTSITTGGIRSATMTFNSDGTITYTRTPTTNTALGPPTGGNAYLNNPQAGAGSAYWVRITTSGVLNTTVSGMTSGTWYQLNVDRALTVQNSSTNLEGYGSFAIAFSTDSGSTVAASFGAFWDVGYTP